MGLEVDKMDLEMYFDFKMLRLCWFLVVFHELEGFGHHATCYILGGQRTKVGRPHVIRCNNSLPSPGIIIYVMCGIQYLSRVFLVHFGKFFLFFISNNSPPSPIIIIYVMVGV